MRPGAARSLLAATCGVWIAACSLTTSLSGFSGGAVDAIDGAASPDGPAMPADGGADSPRNAEAEASVPFCESLSAKATFCDDFERTALLGGWTSVTNQGGAGSAIEAASGGRSGRALHADLPLLTADVVEEASLKKELGLARDVDSRAALFIDALPTAGGGVQIQGIIVAPSSSELFAVYLFIRPEGISYVEQQITGTSEFQEHSLATPITTGSWHNVGIHLSLDGAPHAVVTVDGAVAWDAPSIASFKPGQVTVAAGAHYAPGPTGPLSFHVDDVAITAK